MFVLMLVQCAFIVTFVLCVEYDNNAKPNIDKNMQGSESAQGKTPGNDRVMQTYPSKWIYMYIYVYMQYPFVNTEPFLFHPQPLSKIII